MNVLKSYRLDSGVDALLRESLGEVHANFACCIHSEQCVSYGIIDKYSYIYTV